jgi:hypothetical protein
MVPRWGRRNYQDVGARAMGKASVDEQNAVWRYLWEQDPFKMASKMHGTASNSINMKGIFANREVNRQKWARFSKTQFVWMCQLTVFFHVATKNNKDQLWMKQSHEVDAE